jgi:EAL domain-containing protein (putative c-di-GMP-specific phosphodiesterase class I)
MSGDALEGLLRGRGLDVHFQPVVCLKQQQVIGLEVLARPQALPVNELFAEARRTGSVLQLDRH